MKGWYYDRQLNDPLTSVSLHPNKEYDTKTKTWKNVEDGDTETYFRGDKSETCGYSSTPIAQAILQDDFNVAVANRWTPVGDNAISEIWNKARTIGPYIPVVQDMLSLITATSKNQSIKSAEEGNAVTSTVTDILGTVSTLAKGGINLLSSRINDSLIIQGSRFTYYSGSGTAFGNLGLKYTIFPKFDVEKHSMISTVDQVKIILPYVNGTFEESGLGLLKSSISAWANSDEGLAQVKTKARQAGKSIKEYINEGLTTIDSALSKVRANKGKTIEEARPSLVESANSIGDTIVNHFGVMNEEIKNIADDTLARVDEYFKGLISWQKAPGGYKPSYKDIDAPQEGTLKLRIGTNYSISSLLCQDITMNFSKVMVKDPFTEKLSPLYCDINLTLTPATMYSNNSLVKFITGVNNIYFTNTNPVPGSGYSTAGEGYHTKRLKKQQEYLRRNYNV